MPEEFQRYGEGWKRLHPEWILFDWDETSLPKLENQRLYDAAETIAPHNVGQFRADIARLELVYRFGGVYVDCDMEPRKPIDELLQYVRCFAAWEKQDVWLNNAVFGAVPQHHFISLLIENLPGSVEAHKGSKPNVMTGPQYWTRMFRAISPVDIMLFDQQMFYPYSWGELEREDEEFPDAYGVHRWANRRKARKPQRPSL